MRDIRSLKRLWITVTGKIQQGRGKEELAEKWHIPNVFLFKTVINEELASAT